MLDNKKSPVLIASISNKRIVFLDWLRGLCTLLIMIYHIDRGYDPTIILNKFGVYRVSMFFVLSGLCLITLGISLFSYYKTELPISNCEKAITNKIFIINNK
jgi:hypothetical protein